MTSAGTAVAQQAPEEGHGPFSDDDGSAHEPALDALAAQGVLAGMECGEGLICPHEPLKRWEMAVWLVRVLDGADPTPVDSSRFADVDAGRWSAPFVDRLAALDVTAGCATEPARFCPEGSITRAQMATFLTRAFDLETAPRAGFADVDAGGVHSANIDALAGAGITSGCSRDPLGFCPAQVVTRAQMATFLARALDVEPSGGARLFSDLGAGRSHTCGLRTDGTIACWGDDSFGQSDAPDGRFSSVGGGHSHTCGLRTDGTIACWGDDSFGQSRPPEGDFIAISVGSFHSCGVRADETVACWGNHPAPPAGPVRSVSAGFSHSCSVRDDLSVACWGNNQHGQADAPEGQFKAVSAGLRGTCGIRSDLTLACWGDDDPNGVHDPPAGTFVEVSLGLWHACGVRSDGAVDCWGHDADGRAFSPDGEFTSVSVGERHSCGLHRDGTVACWGAYLLTPLDAADGEFEAVDSLHEHTCGLRTDSTVACWGNDRSGRSYPLAGPFAAVSAGERHTCGLRTDGAVACWGDDQFGQSMAPDGAFQSVSAGGVHTCGLRTDGTVACWGGDHFGQSGAPEGHFKAVSAGLSHSCAVATDGSVECWGIEDGRIDASGGEFQSVAAGGVHSCGLKIDGTVVCWSDTDWTTWVPDGQYTSISTGFLHSCGTLVDGTTACWGGNEWGQANAPEGRFSAVTAGHTHSCALRTDGGIQCWGAETRLPPTGVSTATGPVQPDPPACRPFGRINDTTAGFPLPEWAVRSNGAVRVSALFVDFQDAAAAHTVDAEAEHGLPHMERYLEHVSYGRLDLDVMALPRWLRADGSYRDYLHRTVLGQDGLGRSSSEAAIGLADPEWNFDGHDVAVVVMPSSHFSGGEALGSVRTSEGEVDTVRVNTHPFEEVVAPHRWGKVAAHEVAHALGLLDLYPYDDRHQRPEPPEGRVWVDAEFGIMGLHGYFLADPQDPRLAHDWVDRDGHRSTGYRLHLGAREMLAWSRWQLGWIDPDQMSCVTENEATVQLSRVARPGDGIAVAAVPLSRDRAIVVESRRKTGFDERLDYRSPDGARTSFPALITEGVLVYTVDASRRSGDTPVKLPGDTGDGIVDDYPVLKPGDSVTVWGYTIKVVDDDGDIHTVTITKVDGGG